MGASARGSGSRGLAKGTYVRGGACVAALGAHVARAGHRSDPGSRVNSFARGHVCGRDRWASRQDAACKARAGSFLLGSRNVFCVRA